MAEKREHKVRKTKKIERERKKKKIRPSDRMDRGEHGVVVANFFFKFFLKEIRSINWIRFGLKVKTEFNFQ